MKRILAVLLSVVMLTAGWLQTGAGGETAWANQAEASENLIANGGYELVNDNGWADSWVSYVFPGSQTPTVTLDNAASNVKEGARSLKISASASSRVSVFQNVPIAAEQRGKTYKFSQWVKTNQVTGSARNRIIVGGSHIYTESVKGTKDWQLIEANIPVPEDPSITALRVESFFEQGTGTAWFDDASLIPWVPLERITFEQDAYTIPVGGTVAANVSLTPANTSEKEIVWTTSDPTVATVVYGTVTGVNRGVAVVTAASSNGAIRASATIYVASENLIANGSYELVNDKGWADSWVSYVFPGSQTPTVTLDNAANNVKEGARSLKISASASSRVSVFQNVPITAEQRGKTYKFSQWVKTDQVTGSARSRIIIGGSHIYTESVKGTKDWQLIETNIPIPEDPSITALRVESFFEQGTGTAWFDNTSLIPWVPLEEIAFEQEAYTVPVGGTVAANVSLTPANTSEKEIVWTTSDPTVATVVYGTVTGVNTGIAIVTAASSNGKMRASTVVYVGIIGEGITAENDLAESLQGGAASGTIKAYSATGQPLFYAIGLNATQGLLDVDPAGTWSYYPYDSFYGTDRFIVTIRDDQGNYAVSQVTITVHPANRSPVATDLTYTTDKNMPITGFGYVALKDPDGDQLVMELANEPLHGQVVLQANGDWRYTPDNDHVGNDWFALRGSDGHGGEAVAKVYLYTAPRAEELISELIANQPNRNHPRILATNEDFDRIQSLLATDIRVQQWFAKVKEVADTALGQGPAPYQKPDGLRLNMTAPNNIAYLAFVFRVTGEQRYLDRAWLELQHVSSESYPDWGPGHFLDTATITQGVALGYDWLYAYLSDEQRNIVRHAIVEKGLKQALPLYAGMTYWTKNNNNWNFVCNAGMIMGALAVADEEEEIAGAILQGAFKSLQHGLRQYAPDGSALEGPAYWSYGTDYLVYLLSSLETAFGHDFGFSAADGIPATPDYPLYITGPQGPFNYSDGPNLFIPGRLLLWFAEHHQEPGYAWYHQFVQSQAVRITPYDILWYRPELYNGGEPPLKDYYFSRQQAVTMRSSWSDSNALFVGFKGGMNGAPHGDLDIGSFVFDANGVRWASDLGSEDYNLPGFWEMNEEGRRWSYYRKRTEGHNSIVINPSAKPEQKVTAVSKIIKFENNREQGAYAIADMTEAYKDSVVSAQRGVALLDGRRQFLVQDEIRAKLPSELYWFMHTEAQISIEADGKTAILSSGDQRLQVQLLAPAAAAFSVMDAIPLPTSPDPAGQTVNTGVKKLAVHLQNVKNTTISVRMVPLLPGQDLLSDTPDVIPLEQWSVAEGTVAYSTTAPTNQSVVATLLTNEPVTITNNGGSPAYTFENNGSFTFEFIDAAGNKGSAVASVSNIDKVAPTLSISVDKAILTTPNHKLVPIHVTVNADDAGGSGVASVILTSITSNENDNELGDGNTTGDIQEAEFGTSDTSFLLRAERSGNGTGRIYTITYTIADFAGNTNSASATVTVPKGGK